MSKIDYAEVVKAMNLEGFDFVLFGDGSGTTPDKSCGWACVVVENGSTAPPTVYRGGTSHGTNNLAELCPYVFALWHMESQLHLGLGGKTKSVAVVSDSEVTVRCGNRYYERRANAALWAAIEHYERSGYKIQWFHISRNTNPLNAKCDEIAGGVRKYFCENFSENFFEK